MLNAKVLPALQDGVAEGSKVLPALQDGVADGSSSSDSTDSSSSSYSSSSDSEEEGDVPNPASGARAEMDSEEGPGGVPNPTLGARAEITTDDEQDNEEYVPNPALNVNSPSEGEDALEPPPKIRRCSLCYDFDTLLEDYLGVCDELEAAEKKIAELQRALNSSR